MSVALAVICICVWRCMLNGKEAGVLSVGLYGSSVGLVAGVNRVVSMTSICKFAASDRKISVEPSWDIVDTWVEPW